MIDLDQALHRLGLSPFRRKFRLQGKDLAYLQTWGLAHVMKQAAEIIEGRQTPPRNHPVLVAQRATATCCRSCMLKSHGIPKGAALDAEQKAYVLRLIERWLLTQM